MVLLTMLLLLPPLLCLRSMCWMRGVMGLLTLISFYCCCACAACAGIGITYADLLLLLLCLRSMCWNW